jgi:hypothetical protein
MKAFTFLLFALTCGAQINSQYVPHAVMVDGLQFEVYINPIPSWCSVEDYAHSRCNVTPLATNEAKSRGMAWFVVKQPGRYGERVWGPDEDSWFLAQFDAPEGSNLDDVVRRAVLDSHKRVRLPGDADSMNKFAGLYNAYLDGLRAGISDVKQWARVEAAWQTLK